MIKKYFRCTLKTDIVLNASLATEGKMNTLDYIPGSNFLGIVARKYEEFKEKKQVYDIFHSGKVSFGDALIAKGNAQSYAMPFSLFQDKLRKGITDKPVWVHHCLNGNWPKYIQLKQHRGGYFNPDKLFFEKTERKFSLKSAHDRDERRSKEGAMFGFESLRKGQEFIFSVDFEDENANANFINKVCNELTGDKRIGKSKTAQYGQVNIEPLVEMPEVFSDGETKGKKLVIYAESNLCLFNEYGQSTFQPTPEHFGVNGEVVWAETQIRTYSYSPWNSHRNTTNTQRDCIMKGSVIVIDLKEGSQNKYLPQKVGEYREEGLGRVIYNPGFLSADEKGIWELILNKYKPDNGQPKKIPITTTLANLLDTKRQQADNELKIGIAVQKFIDDNAAKFKKVSASQWGTIRSLCFQGEVNSIDKLSVELFTKEDADGKNIGFLMHGVAAQKYWDKGNIREVLKQAFIDNRKLGLSYVIKLATEMAKWKQKQKD